MFVGVVWQLLAGIVLGFVFLALFVIGFVRPRRSRAAENDVARTLASLERLVGGVSAIGGLLARPLRTSRRAAHKSARAGRKARAKAERTRRG